MTRSLTKTAGMVIVIVFLGTANISSQLLNGTRRATLRENAPASPNPDLAQKLSRNVGAGPRVSFPMLSGPDPKQMASSRRGRQLVDSGHAFQPVSSGSGGTLLRQQPGTLLGGPGNVGSEHVESAGSTGGGISPNLAQPARTSANTGANLSKMGMAPRPLPCAQPVVSDVNGANGITTIIFLEPGKHYAIHGCGFGTVPGEAYLVGVKYAPSSGSTGQRGLFRTGLHPDWIRLIPAAGADPHQKQIWTDGEIQMVVDPNASGFYDDYWDAQVVVFPAGKPKIQSVNGFGFWASRATQILLAIPLPASGPLNVKQPNQVTTAVTPWFVPGQVSDNSGHFVPANLLSPSAGSLVLPGHTFAVVRDDNTAGFAGHQDVLLLNPSLLNLAPGFQPSGAQLFTAGLSPNSCSSGSSFSANGNWNVTWSGQYKMLVAWQEQSCGNNGISVYAMDITVTGPRGVSPQFPPAN